RELHPRTWMKEMLFLPCLLALGIGLSLNNARCAGSALQSQIGFHTHAQVWNRAQIATLGNLQIPALEISPSPGGAGFCDLFHLFRVVRDWTWTVSLGALPAHVPRRLLLCLSFFICKSLA